MKTVTLVAMVEIHDDGAPALERMFLDFAHGLVGQIAHVSVASATAEWEGKSSEKEPPEKVGGRKRPVA